MEAVTANGTTLTRRLSIDIFEKDGDLYVDTYEVYGAQANIARNCIQAADRGEDDDANVIICIKQQIDMLYPIKKPI